MKRVLTAVILIPLVVLALFRAPLWLFTVLVLGVALLAAKEYFDIAEKTGYRPMRGLGYIFLFSIFMVSYVGGKLFMDVHHPQQPVPVETAASIAVLLIVFSPFILLIAGMSRDPLSQALSDCASSFLLLPYVGASLASIVLVRSGSNGALFLLVLMLLVWAGDIAAYYVGRAIGKNKLAPRISPGKTWEGAIASAIGATLVALLLLHNLQVIYDFFARIHLIYPTSGTVLSTMTASLTPVSIAIAFAVCVNVAAQFGDLAESMLKRGAGLKDSGALLPGHGGVLDRIDALLFAFPVGWLFYFTVLGRYFRAVAKA